MAWWIQPLEIADENGNPTGRFRMTATSDEGGGGPLGDTSHDHASAEEAQECDRCDEYCSRISGFPPRKERQSERADRDAGEAEKRIRGAMTRREATSGWATVTVPDLTALLAEIDRLTRERDELRRQLDEAKPKRDDTALLRQALERLEVLCVTVDSEWGLCRSFDEIEKDGDLWPEIVALKARLGERQ